MQAISSYLTHLRNYAINPSRFSILALA